MESETRELVTALLDRVNQRDLTEAGCAAFRKAFPNAPPAMLGPAVFHVFTDGVVAAVEWLAAVERCLRDPSQGIDDGATCHLLYHIYNWHQFQALLPAMREGVLELLADAKLYLAEENSEAVRRVLNRLEDMFQGGLQPPEIE